MKDHLFLGRHCLPAIALYQTQQNWKCLHICNWQYTEFHISIFLSHRSLGRKPEFSLIPFGFNIQTNSDHKTQKIKLYSVRVLNRYLIEKNLIQGRVVAKISKFSPKILKCTFKVHIIQCHDSTEECAVRLVGWHGSNYLQIQG